MDKTRVEALRDSADWTQAQLAKKTGVPQGSISRIERGQIPGVLTAMRLARGLNTTVEQLFADRLRADETRRKANRRASRATAPSRRAA
mgnify:CR=1 FL=1